MRLKNLLFKLIAPLFFILSSLIFFYPVWLRGEVPLSADIVVGSYFPWLDYKWGYEVGVPVKNPITSDAISFSFPMRTLAIDLMKSGQWPLWNPYILFGTPLLANFQSAPFTITNVLYFLFDKLTAWSIQIIFQHIFAGTFTYILLRHWKVSKIGSIFGGIIFAFSGFNLIWSQWNAHTLAAAFIPLLIFFVDRFLVSGKLLNGVGISLVLAFHIFSGYPQITFYTFIAVFILWFLRVKMIGKRIERTLFLGLFFILGLGISAPQILPAYELIGLSQRQGESIPFEWAFLSWQQVITFFAPDYFGNHATGNYWGPKNYTSNVGFVGACAFIIASISFGYIKKRKEIMYLILLVIFSLILAFPTPISVPAWETNFLGFKAGALHRSLVLFNLAIACLAGFGLDVFLSSKKRNFSKWILIIPFLVLTSFGIYALSVVYNNRVISEVDNYKIALRNLVLPTIIFFSTTVLLIFFSRLKIIFLLGLFIILFTELFYFGWKFTTFTPRHIVFPETPILEFLTTSSNLKRINGGNVIPANLTIPYKIETPGGYDAVYPNSTAKFIGVLNSNVSTASPQDRYGIITNSASQLLDLTNVEYLLVKKKDVSSFESSKFSSIFDDKSVSILKNKDTLPRAFMVYNWEVIEDEKLTLDKLLDQNFPKDKKIILSEQVLMNQLVNSEDLNSSVEYLDYEDEHSTLEVTTAENGFLFVSDTFYPGWKAYIDDKETRIYRANYNFRAIAVPTGKHKVKFSYKPESFYNGIKVSALSLLMLGVIYLLLKYYAKKS